MIRVVGSPRSQNFIWFTGEKAAVIARLVQTLKYHGFPAFYRQLTTFVINGRPLPVTVAANSGQMAIAYLYAQQQKAQG